jgi:hypothetical protein
MLQRASVITVSCLLLVLGYGPGKAVAKFSAEELNANRPVQEKEWLHLKLQVLGLRLSYPAYRVQLELDKDNAIVFTFLASKGLADQLTAKNSRDEADKMVAYHAQGIRGQVEQLLQEEFPGLWSTYDARVDFKGSFLGPGKEWNSPPRTLGTWKDNQFTWSP